MESNQNKECSSLIQAKNEEIIIKILVLRNIIFPDHGDGPDVKCWDFAPDLIFTLWVLI